MAETGPGRPELVEIGVIGRSHGLAGEFRLRRPTSRSELFEIGRTVTVEGVGEARIEVSRGAAANPILRLAGVDASEHRGKPLLVPRDQVSVEEGELLVADLVGCEVAGVGTVTDVWLGPSADALEVDGGRVMVPLVRDAIRSIDLAARTIEVDLHFIGIE